MNGGMNRELVYMFIRRHVKLASVVATGAGTLSLFLMLLFPDMPASDAAAIAASWPDVVQDLFGDPLRGFTEIHAWANLQVFHITYWVIYCALAALISSGVVAKEIEGKSFDILLSCPVSKAELVLARMAALFVLLLLSVVPVFGGTSLGILLAGQAPHLADIGMAALNGLLLAFVCGSLTLLISVFVPNRLMAATGALAVFGAMFAYEAMLVPLVPGLTALSFLSVFHHYQPNRILLEGAVPLGSILVLSLTGMAVTCLAIVAFRKRDVPL
jgi:ABC-type transport system involved in multi-copper enzyme maturation permease subunit